MEFPWLCFTTPCDWLKKFTLPTQTIRCKLQPIATNGHMRFPALGNMLHGFTKMSSHWLLVIFTFVLIGLCDYFGFGFTTLNN